MQKSDTDFYLELYRRDLTATLKQRDEMRDPETVAVLNQAIGKIRDKIKTLLRI